MIETRLKEFVINIKTSRLFKDSFWAVFGNGLGYVLLLAAGMVVANFLGKDVYGEYGVVKTTMVYMASFAALGLGFTSTKYVAQYISEDKSQINSIIKSTTLIAFVSSSTMAITLMLVAGELSNFLGEPQLIGPFRYLALIIVLKALSTAGIGILSGFGSFKDIGKCNVVSGLIMFVAAVPLTYWGGLNGALFALTGSQLILLLQIYYYIHREKKHLPQQKYGSKTKELLLFSVPVALQESSYTICNWGAIMLLSKYSSVGEVGIYTIAAQWNSIVLFIPSALSNVVLSHLANTRRDKEKHNKTMKTMILVNLACTLFPFLIVCLFSSHIASLYGESFVGLPKVLQLFVFSAIISSCTNVLNSELLSIGKNWLLFALRFGRDVIIIGLVYAFLTNCGGINGAYTYVLIYIVMMFLYFIALIFCRCKIGWQK